jgi:large-conductance mechanosensitive channel
MDSKELADFITNNGVIGLTAGVVIGLVTKDVVFSLVQDIIIPIIVILLIRLHIKSLTRILPNKENRLNIINFIGCLITWILALICTYLFSHYIFIKMLGAKVPVLNQGQNQTQNQNQNQK